MTLAKNSWKTLRLYVEIHSCNAVLEEVFALGGLAGISDVCIWQIDCHMVAAEAVLVGAAATNWRPRTTATLENERMTGNCILFC